MMRSTCSIAALIGVASAATLSAHVMVSPMQSKSGGTQKYEVRVHNEAKAAATAIDVDIPEGVTVTRIGHQADCGTGIIMKSRIIAAMCVLAATVAVAADQTWTGAISDKMCGADHKKMGGKMSERDCTIACTKGGTPYVLVVDGNVYQLSGHDSDLKTHAGHTVNVTGDLKGDTIRVSRVEMPQS